MAKVEVVLPQMGEGIIEATITRWLVELNDFVEEDQPLVEIATDKVDSEIPSPVSGRLIKCFYSESETPKVGDVLAIVEDDSEEEGDRGFGVDEDQQSSIVQQEHHGESEYEAVVKVDLHHEEENVADGISLFVKNFANLRGLSAFETQQLAKQKVDGLLNQQDILTYISAGRKFRRLEQQLVGQLQRAESKVVDYSEYVPKQGEEVVELNRTRVLIAEHMVRSVQTAPHVTSFIEVDITSLVAWRNKVKEDYKRRHKQNLTFTPIISQLVVRSLKQFPNINASLLPNNKLLRKKYINIGIATALPDGNLIVPVVKQADMKTLHRLTQEINDLTNRARKGKLKPVETTEGTFTITNLGQTGNTTGTPIINQPESAILAVGAIKKKPGVVELNGEFTIGVRDVLTLSLSYDHRIIDGILGGAFLTHIAKQLEEFEIPQDI